MGFGFGAIQGGLFLPEAYRSGNFSRLVVSEVDSQTVADVRKGKGTYTCNVAESNRLRVEKIEGIEILKSAKSVKSVKNVKVSKASEVFRHSTHEPYIVQT